MNIEFAVYVGALLSIALHLKTTSQPRIFSTVPDLISGKMIGEEKLPTYFISSEEKIISDTTIKHFDLHKHKEIESESYLPTKEVVDIILTSGASCPDAVVESVLRKVHSFFPRAKNVDDVISSLFQEQIS